MTERCPGGGRQKYLVAVVCIFGLSTSPLFYRMAFASGMHALWVNVLRLAIAAAVMAAIAFLNPKRRKEILHMPRKAFWISALAGTLFAFHLNAWALALANTDSFAASTILGTYVLLTVLFSALILKEKISKSALFALMIATVGVVVCNFGGSIGKLSGNMFALFAAITEALYVLCGRKVRGGISAVAYTTILYASALFWMVVMALFSGIPAYVPAKGVFWAGMLALVTTLLGHSMASTALKYLKAVTVSAIMMSGMLFGPLVVVLFMQDTPTVFTLVGGIIILTGLALYLLMEQREARRLEQAAAPAAEG